MVKLKPQFEVTVIPARREYPRVYMLVGAGGTGARLAALLPKMVNPGEKIIIVDGDHVETKNLSRQHFLPADVGHPKADVVARRIKAAIPPGIGESVDIISIAEKFEYPRSAAMAYINASIPVAWPMVILGCVDNHEARNMIKAYAERRASGVVWIDCGNDMRWGQVVMSFYRVAVNLSEPFLRASKVGIEYMRRNGTPHIFQFDGISRYAPGLYLPPPPDEVAADCGVRLDTQTVAANNMAATAAGAMLAQVIDGLPISTPCVEFSTVPPIMNARAFPPASAFQFTKTKSWWIEPKPKEAKSDGQPAKTETATVV